jgi:hypothetical protein
MYFQILLVALKASNYTNVLPWATFIKLNAILIQQIICVTL